MRVYSLSGEYQDFLGFEDDGTMIDLTRAIAFYEITLNNCLDEPPVDIEELIFNDRLTDN